MLIAPGIIARFAPLSGASQTHSTAAEKSLLFLFCRNTPSCVSAYLGAIEAGHAVALLDEALAPEFKARLIDLYQPEFIAACRRFS